MRQKRTESIGLQKKAKIDCKLEDKFKKCIEIADKKTAYIEGCLYYIDFILSNIYF